MRTIAVLNVGNGACSVVRGAANACCAHGSRNDVSIIDCGRGQSHGESASIMLDHEMSPCDWRALSSLVVTHFDADHWRGLHHVASTTPPGKLGLGAPVLPIYTPAIPFNLPQQAAMRANQLVAVTSPSGIEALDLLRAWRKHANARLVPSAAGDDIQVGGRSHRVLWPPVRVTEGVKAAVVRVLNRIESAAKANPDLDKALREAHERSTFTAEDNLGRAGESRADSLDGRTATSDFPDLLTEDDEVDVHGNVDADDNKGRLDFGLDPQLIRSARRLQNYFSLVFHDAERSSLLCYGDAPRAVVKAVGPQLHRHYDVALAPHHGTQRMPPGASRSHLCLAQGGIYGSPASFADHWRKNHLSTHDNRDDCMHVGQHGWDAVRIILP